jgi:hypothetical protein
MPYGQLSCRAPLLDKTSSSTWTASSYRGFPSPTPPSLPVNSIFPLRNFVNKLWNAGKYLQHSLSGLSAEDLTKLSVTEPLSSQQLSSLPLAERFICSRCHEICGEVTAQLEAYHFTEALKALSDFVWDEFADWYLEVSPSLSPPPPSPCLCVT